MSEKLKNDLFIIRHSYDDHSYIDGKNDTSLTKNGIDIARSMADKVAMLMSTRKNRVIDIHTSSKKRSVETAEILSEALDGSCIPHALHVDDNLRELYHGKIIDIERLSHQQKVDLLQLAWEKFDEQRVNDDLDYHFGKPEPHSKKYEPLDNFIDHPYGESQNEFSHRIRDALSEILRSSIQSNNIPMVITHRGGIREIQNILYAINNNLPIEQSQVCEMSGLKYCEIIRSRINDVTFCVQALDKFIKGQKNIFNEKNSN